MAHIPHTMRAVRMAAYAETPELHVRDVTVPTPGPGQVLVRVEASPIHLDDVVFCRGRHGFRRAVPTTPGFEGSGQVVSVGGGIVTRVLAGRRVAFAVSEGQEGAWAEYVVVDGSRCVPLWDSIDDEQASTLLVDPITALALLDEVRAHKHKGIVQTAPSGTVGRMITRLAARRNVPVVQVAADAEEAALVADLGGSEVLDASMPDFDAKLRRATRAWQATAAIDGVGGAITGRLLAAMNDGAEAILYGLEPDTRVTVDLSELVYRGKTVRGFCFVDRAREQGTRGILAQLPTLRRLADDLRTDVTDRITLEEVPQAVREHQRVLGGGRVLIRPGVREALSGAPSAN